jgi:hypothetical protein
MRENRPYGSEGGEGQTLPDPYHCSGRVSEDLPFLSSVGATAMPGLRWNVDLRHAARRPFEASAIHCNAPPSPAAPGGLLLSCPRGTEPA